MAIVVFDIGKTNLKLSLVEGGAIRHTLSQPNVNLPSAGRHNPPWQPSEVTSLQAWPVRRKAQYCGWPKIHLIRPKPSGKFCFCQ